MAERSVIADIQRNAVAGVWLGILDVANRYMAYGVPFIYDTVVKPLGRYGEGVWAMVFSIVLDFVGGRYIPQLREMLITQRMFVLGIYKLVTGVLDGFTGKGFAVISGGSVKTDPEDSVTAVYMQEGDSVARVDPGSATATFGIIRYVAVGNKRVYYFEAPYKLPRAS